MIRFLRFAALCLTLVASPLAAADRGPPAQRLGPITAPSLETLDLVQVGPNTADGRASILAGQTAGAPQNGIWSAKSMTIPYHSGADFGNTTSVYGQYFIRCTSVSDATRYESCWNLDFYNNTGAAQPWPGASKSVATGTYLQVNGGSQYKATTGGTTGATQPVWPSSGTVQDGSVTWTYQDAGYNAAKSGMSLSSFSTAGGGNHWLVNPNCIIGDGYKNQLYCIELDVGHFGGSDWYVGSPVPGVVALWIGGVTQNTGEAAVMVGSQESVQGKPAWYFGFWCNNALAAGQACFEDWSNSFSGYHTPSFARKSYDIWLQSTSINGVWFNGTYTGAAMDTQLATISTNHVIAMKSGQDICFDGGNACWRYDPAALKMIYRRDGIDVMSVDGAGNIRAKGTITGGVTP